MIRYRFPIIVPGRKTTEAPNSLGMRAGAAAAVSPLLGTGVGNASVGESPLTAIGGGVCAPAAALLETSGELDGTPSLGDGLPSSFMNHPGGNAAWVEAQSPNYFGYEVYTAIVSSSNQTSGGCVAAFTSSRYTESMQVKVLFFGMLKDLAGQASESLDLNEDATLGDLISRFAERVPQMKEMLPSVAMAVNQHYAAADRKLKDGDEIALLPPVSGGASRTEAPARHAAIVRESIDTASLLSAIKQGEDGAAVVFEGIVRNNTRGRKTLYLEYEAYESMALSQLEELAARALRDFKIRDVAIVHRLGHLEVGETSVAIVVASAHRGSAFDSCRWLIDTLKRTVPIWKKEFFQDGAVWADGEPFPPEISRAEDSHSDPLASK
jgi:molybdopterin converting factor subunit 1